MSDFRQFLADFKGKCRPMGLLSLGILSSFFFIACTGCQKEEPEKQVEEKKEVIDPAQTNRLQDAAYMDALKSAATNQVAVVSARNLVLRKMKTREELIRKGLPKDATKEQIQAAFAKDEEWKRLNAERLEQNKKLQQVAQKNKDLVANRLRAEQEARKNLKQQK